MAENQSDAGKPPAGCPAPGGFFSSRDDREAVMALFCRSCDAEVGWIGQPVRRRGGRVMREGRTVRRGHVAVWCASCRLASEYEVAG